VLIVSSPSSCFALLCFAAPCCRSLPYNQLTGGLPPQWGQMSSLQILKLNNNKLRGGVTQTWGDLKQISTM
jgi:hypothetical protein